MQIAKIFKSTVSLSFFTACVDKNYGWFTLFLLFEKEVFLQLHSNGFGNSGGNNKDSSGDKNKVESGVKKKCVYGKDEKLL